MASTGDGGPMPPPPPPPTLSFTFSRTSRANIVPTVHNHDDDDGTNRTNVEFVTEISARGIRSAVPRPRKGPLVIPLVQRWAAPAHDPSSAASASASASPSPSPSPPPPSPPPVAPVVSSGALHLGLNVRGTDEDVDLPATSPPPGDVPLLWKNRVPGLEDLPDEDAKFRHDVAQRPDEAAMERYEEVPVEEFGKAVLRGMGWRPGKAIGKNQTGLVEPVEFVPRPHRLGLGATPKAPEVKQKKYIKPGESRAPRKDMVLPPGADGRARHVKSISERLVPRESLGLAPGKLVAILAGQHDGLYARVVRILSQAGGSDAAVLRLTVNDEEVIVERGDITLLDESKLPATHPALQQGDGAEEGEEEEEEEEDDDDDDDEGEDRMEGIVPVPDGTGKRERLAVDRDDIPAAKSPRVHEGEESSGRRSRSWLHSHVRVKVISKKLGGGKYYLRKGRILDVTRQESGREVCTLLLDGGTQVLEGVSQRELETVLPKANGGQVLIVRGPHRGHRAVLLKRDGEHAIVQLEGELDVLHVHFDDVAEYVLT